MGLPGAFPLRERLHRDTQCAGVGYADSFVSKLVMILRTINNFLGREWSEALYICRNPLQT